MRVLDLFSGIGGFSLGLERAGMRTIAFVENDIVCRAILKKRWPDTPIFGDIRRLKVGQGCADVVCGGFPCQPFSTASSGKQRGIADDRWLWPEMRRIIQECKPAWVIGENVAGIEGVALEQVVSDLEADDYEVAPPFAIPSCSVGRDHRRIRYWFLAHANKKSEPFGTIDAEMAIMPGDSDEPKRVRATHGIPRSLDRARLERLGNSVDPSITEILGRAMIEIQS